MDKGLGCRLNKVVQLSKVSEGIRKRYRHIEGFPTVGDELTEISCSTMGDIRELWNP